MRKAKSRTVDVGAELRRLPKPNPAVVAAMQEMLQTDSGSLRPPEQAARLMAFLYELHKIKAPAPHREVMANVIGGARSKWTVDTILYQKIAEDYLQQVVETTVGETKSRSGIRQVRYFIPSKRVLDTARRAERGMN